MSTTVRREPPPAAGTPTLLEARFLHPRYWGTWLAVALMWFLGQLPFPLRRASGSLLGSLMFRLMGRRRRIASVNLALCFPELDDSARAALLRSHFRALGQSLTETGAGWWASAARLRPLGKMHGLEHLERALARNKGVLLVSAHFTAFELGMRFLGFHFPVDATYRPHNNVLYERLQLRARAKHVGMMIPGDDIRTLFTRLKANHVVWYAPDQNYNPRHSVFVPFMGVPAATITATARIARVTGAAVVPYFPHRLPGGQGYEVVVLPALEDFPSGDAEADAERVNRVIEAQVRRSPEQYLWVHRRFKSRPPGEPSFY